MTSRNSETDTTGLAGVKEPTSLAGDTSLNACSKFTVAMGVFLPLFLVSAPCLLCSAWVGYPSQSARGVGIVKDCGTRTASVMTMALSQAHEPAGSAHLFSVPRSLRSSVRTGRKRAKLLLRRKSRKKKGKESSKLYSLDEGIDRLSIPSWALDDIEEKRHLAATKAILAPEFERLNSRVVHSENASYKRLVVDAFPDVYSDLRLLRFLRKDKVQNSQSAADRYRSFLQWREQKNVDQMRERVGRHPFSVPHHLQIVDDYVSCDFDVTEELHPDTITAILHVGSWDTGGVTDLIKADKLSLNDFLQYWIYMFESLNQKLHDESIKRKRLVHLDMVCDLRNLSKRHFSPGFLSIVLKPWVTLAQSNYPETSKRIFLLNPPKVVSIAWKIVTPLISPGTLAKIHFHRDYKKSCHDFVREGRHMN